MELLNWKKGEKIEKKRKKSVSDAPDEELDLYVPTIIYVACFFSEKVQPAKCMSVNLDKTFTNAIISYHYWAGKLGCVCIISKLIPRHSNDGKMGTSLPSEKIELWFFLSPQCAFLISLSSPLG